VLATVKRALPWITGLLAFLAWRVAGVWLARRPRRRQAGGGRVCVIQVNALGDVLMVTPLLGSLVAARGAGAVDVLVTPRTVPLLDRFPGLGERLLLEDQLYWRRPASVRAFLRTARTLRGRRYDAVLDASRLVQTAWLTFLARPVRGIGLRLPRRLGPMAVDGLDYLYTDEVPVDPDAHMVRQNLALLDPLGIAAGDDRMHFEPGPADREAAGRWLAVHGLGPDRPFVAMHPGAKWPPKRWPAERFGQLAARLEAQGEAVVLLGDAADRPLLDAVTAATAAQAPLVMAGELPLGAVGALIQRARLFMGNDSGLMHLACAVGTPTIALFGPTLPERTGPLGLAGHAVAEPIACRPCRLYFTRDRCERGHNYCMDLIAVDAVWALARLSPPTPAPHPGADATAAP
jgi:predicted lipopolysaccharide heptosyltransferase III